MTSARKKLIAGSGRATERYVFTTPGAHTFTMPWTGYLTAKVWGGGAGGIDGAKGGDGGYARSKRKLEKGTVIQLYVAPDSQISMSENSGNSRLPGPCNGLMSCAIIGSNADARLAFALAGGGGAPGGTDTNTYGGRGGDSSGPMAEDGQPGGTFNGNASPNGGQGGASNSPGGGAITGGNQTGPGSSGSGHAGGNGGSGPTNGGPGGQGWYGGGGGGFGGSSGGGGGGGSCRGDIMSKRTGTASVSDPDYDPNYGFGQSARRTQGKQGRIVLLVSSR